MPPMAVKTCHAVVQQMLHLVTGTTHVKALNELPARVFLIMLQKQEPTGCYILLPSEISENC